ncbi:MAG: hypothetical protein HW412_1397, partial [Bacteroidetes bacterium]|nr:hypothetical protein [Bacteroidota bacterium]
MWKKTLILFHLVLLSSIPVVAQLGDRQHRRAGIVEGNSTQTAFTNWGVIGQPAEQGRRGAWKYYTNGYIGDASIFLGIEFPIRDYNGNGIPDTVHSVITCPVARPTIRRDEDPVTGKSWTFEPRPGFFAPAPNQSVAISNRPETWPAIWPDHPEWGSGVWNGLYGPNVFVGSQETYFQMDDQNDEHYNFAQNNPRGIAFHPDSTNLARYGAAISLGVRYIQVSHPLFKDILFRVFDIKNESKVRYPKVVFGTLTGTYIGVTSTEGVGEYDDDVAVYFASSNSILSWDFDNDATRNPRWQGPVG